MGTGRRRCFLIELNTLMGLQGTSKEPLDSIAETIWSGVIRWTVIIIKLTLSQEHGGQIPAPD